MKPVRVCCFYVVAMKLLDGRCCFYGSREKVKDSLQLTHVKALVTSHESQDWQSALSTSSQVSLITYYESLYVYFMQSVYLVTVYLWVNVCHVFFAFLF